ncbi:MAG TPA: hypothetical protein VML75_08055 [Kofleriaceae bacterium]|nr:hypothetical protein [Kofleriaceae bacterium]
MAKLEPTVERRAFYLPPLKRASWGAILGGAFIALAFMTMLGALGLAIGFSTIDPASDGSPSAKALGIGAAIWWLVSGIVALFAGGWAAGRLSGLRRRMEGTLHGVVTWAVYSIVATVVTATMVGSLISGAMGVVTTGARVAASGAGAVASQLGSVDVPDVAWQQVWGDVQGMLRDSEVESAQPGELDETRAEAMRELRQGNVEAALETLRDQARAVGSEVDRESVVNVLVENTSMTREEARKAVDRWMQHFQSVKEGASDLATQGRDAALEVAEKSADALAWAGWWTFFYLFLTAIAAGVGGTLGAPRTDERATPGGAGVVAARTAREPASVIVPPPAETGPRTATTVITPEGTRR